MTGPEKSKSDANHPGVSFVLFMLLWTLLIFGLSGWKYYQDHESSLRMARSAARFSFGKDLTFRRWATRHGGVYVPVTAENPPSPYLAHVPERDIVTPSGRPLTLINPAYMIRQVHEVGDDLFGSRGHITSLRPRRPENAADAWETFALRQFETGAAEEWSSLAPLGEQTYLRLMRPLRAEEGCLKCHAVQGYRVGDIMGGISVSIPWEPYRHALRVSLLGITVGYGSIWLLGISFIERSRRRLRRHLEYRRQAERTLRRRSRELEERSRELERFTYTVSHDLKTPVVTIKSFLGFLEEDMAGQATEDTLRDIGYIRAAADKMEALLAELLELSRVGRHANPPSRVPFAELMQEVLTLTAGSLADRGVEVRVEPTGLTLFGDRPRLVEIWQNLLDNAAKYMGDQPAPLVLVGVENHGVNGPIFFVRDNGSGVEAEYREKIFGVFERLDTSVEGTGLGLAMVKRIVELHGGKIWVESAGKGQGTCFRFTLPEALRQTAEPEADEETGTRTGPGPASQ